MNKYKKPSVTTDIFIFDENFNFILIKRKNNPFKNCWALPGGFVDYGETVESAAIKEAKEETSMDVKLKDLVNVYSNPDRDSRGHTINITYTAKGDFNERKANDDAIDISIFSAAKLDEIKLAFDHNKIIKDCLNMVKNEK